ncbi:flagellar basal body-associated protein FliL [Frigidibacter sp. MR17.14]|uniref:flagellar basal body-associated protein FliL n=1 Tax=Frigidibacter sp. MR17.14 TaxID=3126509 RepID=UPI0030130846
MALLLPLILVIFGLGAGVGAGLLLRPAPAPVPESAGLGEGLPPCGPAVQAGAEGGHEAAAKEGEEEVKNSFVKFNNQFVVPVVTGERVSALVILSLALEVPESKAEEARTLEPKFRDAFLRVLFDHANQGGFEGAFTGSNNMKILHTALLESARGIMGEDAIDVLISDYMRQDR